MNAEKQNHNIPLARRDWPKVWMVLACAGVAWLFRRPTGALDGVLTCLLGGTLIWFAMGPGLYVGRLQHMPLTRFVARIACLFVFVFAMQNVIPWILVGTPI